MLSEQMNVLSELTELYDCAKSDLERIRNEYGDNKILLSFYEGSALRLVELIQERIQDILQFSPSDTISADVWIKLEGPKLEADQIPIGLVGKFLQGISVANKHAVSIMEGLKHGQGRFQQKVHELAEFSLASVSPGSIKIGIRSPSVERFLPIDFGSDQQKLFEQVEYEIFSEAKQKSERALEGLSLLIRTIESVNDDEKMSALLNEVGQRNVLRLLYHAQELTPSKRGAYVTVSVSGKALPDLTFDLETRERLKVVSERLLDNQRYITAFGKIRMVDMDKRIIKARPFYSDGFHVDEIEGKLSDEMKDEDFEVIINKAVRLSGLVVLSETGDIKHLEVDDIILDEPDK